MYFTCEVIGVDKLRISAEIERIAELLGLKSFIKDKVFSYSSRTIKKLTFAQAILCNPEILVIDEPYNGLEYISINRVRTVIKELKDKGSTIFVSSHLLSEIKKICEEVVFINDGRIILQDRIEKLKFLFKLFNFLKSKSKLKELIVIEDHEKFGLELYQKIQSDYPRLGEMFDEKQFSNFHKIEPILEDIFLSLVE